MAARNHLGLARLPFNNTLSMALRSVKGGLDTVLEYARMLAEEGDARFQRFVHCYDQVPMSKRGWLHPEDFCAAAEINPADLIGAITAKAYQVNSDVASLIASMAHPRAVEKLTEIAQTDEGEGARRVLFQHMRFTPVSRGAQIAILNNPNMPGGGAGQSVTVDGQRLLTGPGAGSPAGTALPSFEGSAARYAAALRAAPDGASEGVADVIDAEIVGGDV